MSSATSSSAHFGPRLPYEVIELIIREAWLMHNYTLRERMDMYTSFSLVSLDFAWEFTRVFMSHVHIFSHAHYYHFIQRTYNNDTCFLQMMRKLGRCLDARTACRSITTHCHSNPDQLELEFYMPEILDSIAYIIPTRFPRVHCFGIVYHDWTVSDGDLVPLSLPEQVEVLEVAQVMSVKRAPDSHPPEWRYSVTTAHLPHIHRLKVYGGGTDLTTFLTKTCPNAKVVIHNCHDLRGISSQKWDEFVFVGHWEKVLPFDCI